MEGRYTEQRRGATKRKAAVPAINSTSNHEKKAKIDVEMQIDEQPPVQDIKIFSVYTPFDELHKNMMILKKKINLYSLTEKDFVDEIERRWQLASKNEIELGNKKLKPEFESFDNRKVVISKMYEDMKAAELLKKHSIITNFYNIKLQAAQTVEDRLNQKISELEDQLRDAKIKSTLKLFESANIENVFENMQNKINRLNDIVGQNLIIEGHCSLDDVLDITAKYVNAYPIKSSKQDDSTMSQNKLSADHISHTSAFSF